MYLALYSIIFNEVSHLLLQKQGFEVATKKIETPKFPPPFFDNRVCPGLKHVHIMEICKRVARTRNISKETLYKKALTYATQTDLYPRKIRGNPTKVRVLQNFISITVYRDSIIARCKSEKRPKKGTRTRKHYEVEIYYGRFPGNISIHDILNYSSCTCKFRHGLCKHILGTLILSEDLEENILRSLLAKNLVPNEEDPLIVEKNYRQRKFQQVLGVFVHPNTKEKRCLVRTFDTRFDSNLSTHKISCYQNKKALNFHTALIHAARTDCARRIYFHGNDWFSTR